MSTVQEEFDEVFPFDEEVVEGEGEEVGTFEVTPALLQFKKQHRVPEVVWAVATDSTG